MLVDNGFSIGSLFTNNYCYIRNYNKEYNGYRYSIQLQKYSDTNQLCTIISKGVRIRSYKYPVGYDSIENTGIGSIAVYYTQMKKIYNTILRGLGITEDELLEIDVEDTDNYQDNLGFGGITNGIVDSVNEVVNNSEEGEYDGGIVVPDKNICIGFVASAWKNPSGEYDMIYPYPVLWVATTGKYRNIVKDAISGTSFKIKRIE